MNLTIKQTKALDYLEDNTTSELLFGGGAGGGKSALGVYWLLKMCHKYPQTRWLMGRAKLKTLKETTLNSFFEIAKSIGLKAGLNYKFNQQSGVIAFPNGSEILIKDLFLYPSDPNFDELGSLEITGAFIDECNQVVYKAVQIVKSRIRYKLDENGLIPKMLMTCNPAKNWVFTEFYGPSSKGELNKKRRFIQSLLNDNKYISKHYKENLLSLDENSKQRLLYGNWNYQDDPTVLIPFQNITNIFTNTFVQQGTKYITADIARYGRDLTVIGVWSGFRLFKVVIIPKSGLDEVKEKLERIRLDYEIPLSNIVVDEDGVGGGVVDFMKCKGFVNNSSPVKVMGKTDNFRNLKGQCTFGMADIINTNQMYCSVDGEIKEKIIEELGYWKQKNMDKDNKKEVLGKDEIKEQLGRSPDYADMIHMRYFFELKPKYFLVGS